MSWALAAVEGTLLAPPPGLDRAWSQALAAQAAGEHKPFPVFLSAAWHTEVSGPYLPPARPPAAGASEALRRLRSAGLRVAALALTTTPLATAELEGAGLDVDLVLGADQRERYRPAGEPYAHAMEQTGGTPWVLSASWQDVVGARSAGLPCAYCGAALPAWVLRPDVLAGGVAAAADEIIRRTAPRPPSA